MIAAVVLGLWRRRGDRHRRRATKSPAAAVNSPAGGEGDRPAPFPRQLDEARQLLELRQSEGRVAVLDALRGMFLDDELQKLSAEFPPEGATLLNRLQAAIDERVNQVAPLSTQLSE